MLRTSPALAVGAAALALAACGSSVVAKPARYSSSYPKSFAATFTRSCSGAHDSGAMCQCALQRIQGTVTYTALVSATPAILHGDVPWFDALQLACKRRGSGSPPYVAPRAFEFLAAQASQARVAGCERALAQLTDAPLGAPTYAQALQRETVACQGVHHGSYSPQAGNASGYPASFAASFLSSCTQTGSANGEGDAAKVCQCALTVFEASESYATAASELAAGTLGKDQKLLSAMVACGAK